MDCVQNNPFTIIKMVVAHNFEAADNHAVVLAVGSKNDSFVVDHEVFILIERVSDVLY